MKKIAAAIAAVALGGGLALVGTVGPASAHTPAASATCDVLTVNASQYETKPGEDAVYESRLVKEAVPYQPAVYGEPPLLEEAVEYQPAVYEVEYQYKHKLLPWKVKWTTDPNWNAEGNPNSLGWYKTGETRDGDLISPEVPAKDAVYGPAPLITPEVPAQEAVYEDVLVSEAVPADDTPNSVLVEINGAVVANDEFGTSYSNQFNFANKYVANDWVVTVTAWNDEDGSKGWTKTFWGTTEPCAIPVVPANPGASIEASCGVADVTLTNEQAEYESNKTASFTILVDDEVVDTPVAFADEVVELSYEFAEDSGEHTVVVKDSFSWETLAEATVESDCKEPPVTEEPEEPTKPTEPSKPTEPKPATPAVVTPPSSTPTATSGLAETGFDLSGTYLYATLATIVIGAGLTALTTVALYRRRKAGK